MIKKEQVMTIIKKIVTKLINLQTHIKLLPYSYENSLFTHLTLREKYTLLSLSGKCKGNNYVEIGSYIGASSCFIAAGIKESNGGGAFTALIPSKMKACPKDAEIHLMSLRKTRSNTRNLLCR
jgi:hypothetical protein